jgi:hypothetical protein
MTAIELVRAVKRDLLAAEERERALRSKVESVEAQIDHLRFVIAYGEQLIADREATS